LNGELIVKQGVAEGGCEQRQLYGGQVRRRDGQMF
jgi:hypothetical protein